MKSTVPRLQLVTDATSEPVTPAEAKLFCRVDLTDDDSLIVSLIAAARRRVEKDTSLALKTQTWRAVYDGWPGQSGPGLSTPWWDGVKEGPLSALIPSGTIEIPKRPFQAVTQMQLLDAYGVITTIDPSIYFVETSDMRGAIVRKLGATWPIVILSPRSGLQVTFTAGFDASPYSGIPDDLLAAIKMLVKHWYDHREFLIEGRATPTPHGYEDIINGYRPARLR